MAYPGIYVCTDGAPSMVGSVKGFASLVEKQNANIVRTHCFLHREVLFSKITQNELNEVLSHVIEMVNFIKTRPTKSRVFELLFKIWILLMFVYYCTQK